MTNPLRSRRMLGALFVIGLLLRAIFVLYGAKAYYSGQPNVNFNGDSFSYMRSFENLFLHGSYSFDFLEPEAAFGRLPGYPFFYGLHYLIFGARHAVAATVWSQALIDSCGILLMFGILRRALPQAVLAPLVGAALYAFYPFIIIWVPIVSTETLSTVAVLLWVYCLIGFRPTVAYAIGFGLLLAVLFYIREYLGILVPVSLLCLLLTYRRQLAAAVPAGTGQLWLRAMFLVCVGFGMLYILWPIRNYVTQHRIMLVKPPTAGYATYGPDMNSFRSWVQCWTNDENPWIAQAMHAPTVTFPAGIFANAQEEAEAQRLVGLAKQCGRSFYLTRTGLQGRPEYRDTAAMRRNPEYIALNQRDCSAEISAGFLKLKDAYRSRNPLKYYLDVPLQNLGKAFFKSSTSSLKNEPVTAKTWAMRVLFGYRSVLVLLAVAGLWVFRRNAAFLPVTIFAGFMYFFICFLLRSLEMRYLLQADVLLLVPAAALLGHWFERWFPALRRLLAPESGPQS